MELTFEITNQSLKRIDTNKPADYSNEYLKCQFDFQSEDWGPMGKFAIFKTGELNYRVAINDGECIVPFDALQVNQFALTVYGIDGDTRITTNLVYIKLGKSGFVTEYDESSYFNPDMTEELLDMVEQKVYISVFDETVTGINESIGGLESSKLDKTTYNTDIPVIREDIADLENSKVDNTTFNDTVESINTSIGELDTNKTVTITKQATADTGYFSTYVINQGGTALSPKINIPKDYLLKSASLKQCTVKDEPIEGLNVGDWYFDWVLNTADETEESHLYLNANVLTDVYEGDNETIIISDNVISVKPNVFAFKSHTHSKSDITDFTHTHSKSDITDFNHTHTKSDITNFNHTHTESDITDLKDYALESDVYSKSEVDQLIYDLNNKMNVNSDKTIIQTGETSNITIQVKEHGFPAPNKTVNIYKEE